MTARSRLRGMQAWGVLSRRGSFRPHRLAVMVARASVVAAPMLALALTRHALLPEPVALRGSDAATPPVELPDFTPLHARVPAAARSAWTAALSINIFDDASPFALRRIADVLQTAVFAADEPDAPRQAAAPEPDFALRCIVTGRVAVATINGRPCTVGDEVCDGWTLARIDETARTVFLRAPSGRTKAVALATAAVER